MKHFLDIWRSNRFNPWQEASSLQRQMDRLFQEFDRYEPVGGGKNVDFVPPCDVEETDKSYLFTLDVPGLSKDQLEVQISGNTLLVSGEKREEKKGKGPQSSYERYEGHFARSFTLPEISASSKVEADYKDGVLRIAVPKSESAMAKTRKIPIGNGNSSLFLKGEKAA